MRAVLLLRRIQLDIHLLFLGVYVKLLSERLIVFFDHLELDGALRDRWEAGDTFQVRMHLPMHRFMLSQFDDLSRPEEIENDHRVFDGFIVLILHGYGEFRLRSAGAPCKGRDEYQHFQERPKLHVQNYPVSLIAKHGLLRERSKAARSWSVTVPLPSRLDDTALLCLAG